MKTTNSLKVALAATHQAESSDYKLMRQQENPTLHEEENLKGEDWLLNQFSRVPFLLYKFWLVINFPITLLFEYYLFKALLDSYVDMVPLMQISQRMFASLVVSFSFFLYGCCKMLFAMSKRNSKFAQESVVQFQYNLIGSMMGLMFLSKLFASIYEEKLCLAVFMYGAISAPVHLLGGFAVLKLFQENHPLVRRSAEKEDESSDFLQQNQVIGAEVSKYDEQLNSWPCKIYKWWLKFVVIFEISLIFDYILYNIVNAASPYNDFYSACDVLILIGLLLTSLLNAYSSFEMDVVTRTRTLGKSKRALALLKICNVLSIVLYISVAVDIRLEGHFRKTFESFSTASLHWLGCIVIPPLLNLIGAVKVNKILEQRDQFAQISNYTNDSYL